MRQSSACLSCWIRSAPMRCAINYAGFPPYRWPHPPQRQPGGSDQQSRLWLSELARDRRATGHDLPRECVGARRTGYRGKRRVLAADGPPGFPAITASADGTTELGELRYKAWGETRFTSDSTPTTRRFTGQVEHSTRRLYSRSATRDIIPLLRAGQAPARWDASFRPTPLCPIWPTRSGPWAG